MPGYAQVIEWFYHGVLAYLAAGVFFGCAFVTWGVQRIDTEARDAGWGFRVLILPGVIVLWPALLRRWIARTQPRVERNAHRCSAR